MLERMNLARRGAGARSSERVIKRGCHSEPEWEIAMPRFILTAFDRQTHQRLMSDAS